MSIIVSNCQHCDEQLFEHCHVYTTDFLSSKVKFIHTSTVTHSCYRKKLCVRLAHILLYISLLEIDCLQSLEYVDIFMPVLELKYII